MEPPIFAGGKTLDADHGKMNLTKNSKSPIMDFPENIIG